MCSDGACVRRCAGSQAVTTGADLEVPYLRSQSFKLPWETGIGGMVVGRKMPKLFHAVGDEPSGLEAYLPAMDWSGSEAS